MDIGSEIRQGKPFQSAAQELALSVLRSASLLQYHFERRIRASGLTQQQYNILRILRGSPEGLASMDIAQRLVQPTPGISRLLERLSKKGLIRRQASPSDRRVIHCQISPAGLSCLDQLQDSVEAFDRDCRQGLDPELIRHSLRCLERLRANLCQTAEP